MRLAYYMTDTTECIAMSEMLLPCIVHIVYQHMKKIK